MQAFIEFLVGLMAVLLTAVLGQLGLDAETQRHEPREIHRTTDCPESGSAVISTANRDC